MLFDATNHNDCYLHKLYGFWDVLLLYKSLKKNILELKKMFNFMTNNLKSICLRSMILCFWKSSHHRRRSYYYVFYATVLIIFSLLVIAWMMILTQLSTNFNDNKLAKSSALDTPGMFSIFYALSKSFLIKLYYN